MKCELDVEDPRSNELEAESLMRRHVVVQATQIGSDGRRISQVLLTRDVSLQYEF